MAFSLKERKNLKWHFPEGKEKFKMALSLKERKNLKWHYL